MLFSSIVLYLIGNREINDLDLYIDYVDPEIAEKVKQFDEDETYKYIEYSMKGNESKWPLQPITDKKIKPKTINTFFIFIIFIQFLLAIASYHQ